MKNSLTATERHALELATALWEEMRVIVGTGSSREADLAEIRTLIHGIENMVLSQSAARNYPDLYRLLWEPE